jgi:hypothetical protein
MPKRLVFTNQTPNDKGSIIPNSVIRWDRFRKNPVCLKNHDWNSDPIGFWTAIQHDQGLSVSQNGDLSGIPVLHDITDVARITKQLYESGNLRGASIGGIATYKADPSGRRDKEGNLMPYINAQGLMECTEFDLYEISLVTLPSNEDAVTTDGITMQLGLSARCYTKEEIQRIEGNMLTLSTKYNLQPMNPTENPTPAPAPASPAPAAEPAKPAAAIVKPETFGVNTQGDMVTMKASELPGFMEKIVKNVAQVLGFARHNAEPTSPKDTPTELPASDRPLHVPQPEPIGLKGAKEKAEMETALSSAETALKAAHALKSKGESDKATDEEKEAYKTACNKAEECMRAAQLAVEKYSTALKAESDGDDEEMETDKKPKTHATVKTTNQATPPAAAPAKPQIKTLEELKTMGANLRQPPLHVRVGAGAAGRTLTELSADKKDGVPILMRVMARDTAQKHLEDYEVVLNSIINDRKYAAIVEKTRVLMNVSEAAVVDMRHGRGPLANPDARPGLSLQQIAQQLASGEVEYMGRDNVLRRMVGLTSTDNALAAPALNTIEWLPLAIFKLFPSTSWKNPIPLFGAQMTGANTGIIWANVEADPTIYKGNQPVNPANYTYSDQGVSLSLTGYWLQPMLWTPLTMHQLRYDQMATGWAQAFAKWNAVMDDNLLYTLASVVPTTAILLSTGISGYQTQPASFYVNGVANINNFYWNPAFVGNLLSPVLNDTITLEQIYNQQDFPMEDMEARLVIDPIMEARLKMDPESKSLLTRFVTDDGKDLLKYSHTVYNQRSRVAIYDPASGQVKDPNGVIPATALSAGLGFIPSQVGLGLGMLDVFMVQDPTNYGYKMSADIRIGANALRSDFKGLSLYTYGPVNV